MKVKTILFDLDGTFIDTAPDLAFALNSILDEYGLPSKPYEKIKPLVANGGKALIAYGFEIDETDKSFNDKHQRILEIYAENISKESKLFPGISFLIKEFKSRNISWGIVTNKPEYYTHKLLKEININPEVVICGDTLEFNKPHPAPLLFACDKLSSLPSECLFVGDDINDMIAGKRAGMKTVAVDYGYGKIDSEWNYDYRIQNAEEILDLL